MSNGRVCANANCHHVEDEHEPGLGCWGKPKEIRKDGPTPGCRCEGFLARRDTVLFENKTHSQQCQLRYIPAAEAHAQDYGCTCPAKRWRFVSDDDGHDYLIPAELEKQFNHWVDSADPFDEDAAEYDGPDFNEFRTGMSPNSYTFTDPKEDK
jgi:hypothetical protein